MNLQQHAYRPSLRQGKSVFLDYELHESPPVAIITVGEQPLAAGTSAVGPTEVWAHPFVWDGKRTAIDRSPDPLGATEQITETPPDATAEAIFELRRTSGLTWDQLAQLFGVSRRNVHFWASGSPMNGASERHLFEILDIVQQADRGDTEINRTALFKKSGGKTPFDLLTAKAFDEARARLGRGPGRRRVKFGGLDLQARIERKPLPPEVLMDALNDPIHRDPGGGGPARTVRNLRREQTK